MSRIGKNPVIIPQGVETTIKDGIIKIRGPKGELSLKYNPAAIVEHRENEIVVTIANNEHSNIHGLTRTLIANMVNGVSKGFEKKLEIQGVGYRAQTQGKKLVLSLGYSHPVEYNPPEGVTVSVDTENKNVLVVSGIDKQQVGQAASEIRGFRPPEPYKGKGIRYQGEYVARKAGKSAAK